MPEFAVQVRIVVVADDAIQARVAVEDGLAELVGEAYIGPAYLTPRATAMPSERREGGT